MTDLRTAAQQALAALEEATSYTSCPTWSPSMTEECEAAAAALRAALTEPCPCGDRPAAQCPGEWEPGCDLGNNPKYAKRVEMTPKELAASIRRGEKWKVAEPVPDSKHATIAEWSADKQRKPLTEEEIKECERQAMVNGSLPFEQRVFFARAIERAHGIGDSDE